MNIEINQRHTAKVLRVNGRMDLERIAILDDTIQELLDHGCCEFVLNLIDVTDISTTGIQRMLTLLGKIEARKSRLVLTDLSPVCEYVLDLADMTDTFTVFDTEDEALAGLKAA